MLRIGEFSRIGRVTIDTLRHYDTLGLLKPAKVDPFTGYRFYTASQLQSLNRIMALKEVGLSLHEISRILLDTLTADELRGMLKAQLVLAESAIETAQLRRERILDCLNHLTINETLPAYEVTLKSVDPLTVAAIRELVPMIGQVPERCEKMFNRIAEWMTGNKLPIGIPMTIYHNEGYTLENIDTECALVIPDIEIARVPRPISPIIVRQMETIPHAATTIFSGNIHQQSDSLRPAYNAIVQWIENHGYHIACAPRELYHSYSEDGDITVEIQFPVEEA